MKLSILRNRTGWSDKKRTIIEEFFFYFSQTLWSVLTKPYKVVRVLSYKKHGKTSRQCSGHFKTILNSEYTLKTILNTKENRKAILNFETQKKPNINNKKTHKTQNTTTTTNNSSSNNSNSSGNNNNIVACAWYIIIKLQHVLISVWYNFTNQSSSPFSRSCDKILNLKCF